MKGESAGADKAGEPRINPDGNAGAESSSGKVAQEYAHKAAETSVRAARVTGKSFLAVFKIWARIAPDPVSRAPEAVGRISAAEAWQSLGWVAVLYGVILPRIEFNMEPMLFRHMHSLLAYAFHAVALCVAMTAAVFGASRLFDGNSTLEKSAFAVSIALIPQWIALGLSGCFFDWTHSWIFGVVGFGACIGLFMIYAVFTRAFGLSDRRATIAVPLALGLGGGVAFYLSKIIS